MKLKKRQSNQIPLLSSLLATSMLLLLLLHLLGVELQLLAFQDVAIAAAALPRARGDACIQATGGELLSHQRVNLAGVQALPELALHMVRGLHLINLLGLLLALQTQLIAVVLLVPGLEGGGVDLHDRVLHQGLGTHQLVVGRVVHHVHNAGLARNSLSGPCKVAGVQAQGPELLVASTHAQLTHGNMRGQLGHRRLATHLVFLLLAPCLLAPSSKPPLMLRITGNSHFVLPCLG
mmetsp:Transcript_20339/g.56673  ORF Transcript_20339/g.56673 Transcript_20339/m.56673 type:complete len:235 (+) Transcript_20339:163-867(+)